MTTFDESVVPVVNLVQAAAAELGITDVGAQLAAMSIISGNVGAAVTTAALRPDSPDSLFMAKKATQSMAMRTDTPDDVRNLCLMVAATMEAA